MKRYILDAVRDSITDAMGYHLQEGAWGGGNQVAQARAAGAGSTVHQGYVW